MTLSLDARLSALEQQVGNLANNKNQNQNASSLSNRLEALRSNATTTLPLAHRDVWKESLKLLQELDPGMALTHQQQPLLYRRQQVLAAAPSLEKDFDGLRQIQHALLTSSPSSGNVSSSTISGEDLVQAPIITDYTNPDTKRVEEVKWKITDLAKRTQTLQMELDQLLEIYHQCMTAASEKCIMAEEQINLKLRQKSDRIEL